MKRIGDFASVEEFWVKAPNRIQDFRFRFFPSDFRFRISGLGDFACVEELWVPFPFVHCNRLALSLQTGFSLGCDGAGGDEPHPQNHNFGGWGNETLLWGVGYFRRGRRSFDTIHPYLLLFFFITLKPRVE